MTTNVLLENDTFVDELRRSIGEGQSGLQYVPQLVKSVIRDNRWRERIIERTGVIQKFDRFEEFVTTLPLEGLGADLPLLKRICADDKEALDLIDQVTTNEPHLHTGKRDDDNIIVNGPEQGTSATYALRRLRKQRPDLHARVLADELTPNAAMIEAGFREPKIQIPHNPARAAAIIKRHFTPGEIEELVKLL